MLYLAGVEKPSLPTIYSRFGKTSPAYCSAIGKAILAHLPEAEFRDYLSDTATRSGTPRPRSPTRRRSARSWPRSGGKASRSTARSIPPELPASARRSSLHGTAGRRRRRDRPVARAVLPHTETRPAHRRSDLPRPEPRRLTPDDALAHFLTLFRRPAAVDEKRRAGDQRGGGRGEEDDGARHLHRLSRHGRARCSPGCRARSSGSTARRESRRSR